MEIDAKVKELSASMSEEMLAIFRRLHERPELSMSEFETTKLVKQKLASCDIELVDLPDHETGVIGLLRGSEGPCAALRAELDALPVQEASASVSPSAIPGVMHACGHDAHCAALLGAAAILSKVRGELGGSVKFIFQPAEETTVGARRMIAAGCLDAPKVGAIFGIHNSPDIQLGSVAMMRSPVMAAVDGFRIRIRGRGGHGGMPHDNADPIVAASSIVLALQTIVSRNTSPFDSAVVSVCSAIAGDGHNDNICPDEAVLLGTVRTYRREIAQMIESRMRSIAADVSSALGCEGATDITHKVPALDNSAWADGPDLYAAARRAASGAGITEVDARPSCGGEDFALYITGCGGHRGVPGFYSLLGTRSEQDGCVHQWHSPNFLISDDFIPLCAELYALCAIYGLRELRGEL